MADKIAANLVLNTSLRAPRGQGLNRVKTELESIKSLMAEINSQSIVIDVRLRGSQQAITSLNQITMAAQNQLNRQQAAQVRRATNPAYGPPRPPVSSGNQPTQNPRGWGNFPGANQVGGGGGGPTPPLPPPRNRVNPGQVTGSRVRTYETGEVETYTDEATRRGTTGLNTRRVMHTDDQGNLVPFYRDVTTSDDAAKARLAREKEVSLRPQKLGYADLDQESTYQQRMAALDYHEQNARASGYQTTRLVGKTVPNRSGTGELQHAELEMIRTLADGREEVKKYSTSTGELSKTQIRQTDASKEALREQRRQARLLQGMNTLDENKNRGDNLARHLSGRNFIEQAPVTTIQPVDKNDPNALERHSSVRTFQREIGGITEIVKYDEALGKIVESQKQSTSAARQASQAEKDLARVRQIQVNQAQALTHHNNLLAEGYTVTNTAQKQMTVGVQQLTTTTREYQRVSGNPILGNLAVEVAKVDSSTGNLTRTTLQGSQAMRKLGDSFSNAISKIGVWFAATTAIFLVARGAQEAVRQFSELEANTVFLARVGQKLGESFQQRLAEAKLLTTGLTELSAVTGVSATESQKAAAVFLRAGQNRVEALQSTKTAMLAASIAELDVEQAAKMLSSAQKQFNLQARDSAGILDTLNSLSNKYVVSTDDLLQSISRGGKIYAESGGQLESLAATTAILGDKTRRSGAEIGNALKTIQTRLTTSDVSKMLSEKLGLSIYDEATGKAKNFTTVLMQLEAAMVGLNDRQRDQIGVTIAGARQYNILKNALSSVADIAIAEAEALRESGSAVEEAQQRANTLTAALGRLKGEFSVLIDGLGASTGNILTGFINLLALILQLASASDGLAIRMAAVVLVFGSIYLVVSRYGASIAGAVAGTYRFATSLLAMGSAANATNVSLLTLLGTARILQTTLISLGIGAVLIGVFYAINSLTESLVAAQIAADAFSAAGDKQIESLTRQKKATVGLSDALQQKIETQRRLNAMGNEAPERDVKKNKEDISKLTTALFGKDFGAGPLRDERYLDNLDVMRVAEKNKHTENLKKAFDRQIAVEQEGLDELEKVKKKTGNETAEDVKKRIQELETKPVENKGTGPEGAAAAAQYRAHEIDSANKKLVELLDIEGKIAEKSVKIKELQAKAYEAGQVKPETPFTLDQRKASRAFNQTLLDIKEDKRNAGFNSSVGKGNSFQETDKEYSTLQYQRDSMLENMKAFKADSPEFAQMSEDINKVTESMEKLLAQLHKEAFTLLKSQASRVLGPINDINAALISSRSKLDFARTEGKGQGGTKFENYNSIVADTEAQRKIAASSASAIIDLKTNKNTYNTGSSIGDIAAIDAHREQISKALEAARQGEANAAKELLKIELDITKERVQQNKEAAKAAGLLSDEDKVKLLSQAEYFRNNPNAEINAKDAFFADSDTNRLGQQFFGSKFNFDQDDALGGKNEGFRNIFGKDFGVSRDTVIAENELAKHGLGPNATEEQRRAFADQNKSNIVGDSDNQATLTGEGMHIDLAIPNPFEAADMQPLVDEFSRVINDDIVKMRSEIIEYIKSVWKPLKDAGIDRTGELPPVAGGN